MERSLDYVKAAFRPTVYLESCWPEGGGRFPSSRFRWLPAILFGGVGSDLSKRDSDVPRFLAAGAPAAIDGGTDRAHTMIGDGMRLRECGPVD